MGVVVPTQLMDKYMELDDKQKMRFDSQFQTEGKDPTIAMLCALFGVYYFYMGNIGLAIANILSSFICVGAIWSIVLLFGAKKNVEQHNLAVAQKIFASL
jgi:hypothetical protein